MSKTIALIAALGLALSAAAADAKPCRDAAGKYVKCPAPSAASTVTSAAAAPASTPSIPAGHPQCKKGKPCGNSCIAMNKVCHK